MEIWHYKTASGAVIFEDWLTSMRDARAKARVTLRVARLTGGNFGDSKHVGDGVSELRIDYGPGYRVYYGVFNRVCILLLCGGEKSTQTADIARAIEYWKDYKRRSAKP